MNEKGYIDSYVAFVDILGFKNFVNNNGSAIISNLFNYIEDLKNKALECFNNLKYKGNEKLKPASNITINIFSDSVIFSCPKNENNSLPTLLYVINRFLFNLLLDYNFLCRGAIAEGEFFAEKNIIFGPALVEAYIMERNLSVYPRVIFTRNTIESYMKTCAEEMKNVLENTLIGYDAEDDLFYADYIKNLLTEFIFNVQDYPTESEKASSTFNSIRKNAEDKISNEQVAGSSPVTSSKQPP